MSESAYPAAHKVSTVVEAHFARHLETARKQGRGRLAHPPDAPTVETIIDAAFWASLRREEGRSPQISLAFLPPEQAEHPLRFGRRLPLAPEALTRLAPAVERPGIHLGLWPDEHGLSVWGTTRSLPSVCFVLEVVEPGLLVIKYRRDGTVGKFGNVAVLLGDQIKIVDEQGAAQPDAPALLTTLLGLEAPGAGTAAMHVLIQLALSMRAHGRGGALLVVPQHTHSWKASLVWPVPYLATPPFSELSELLRQEQDETRREARRAALPRAVDALAGLTAIDGAAVVTDRYELLAFGAKIRPAAQSTTVEQVILAEPIVGDAAAVVHPVQIGGTRHLSAAQFVHDQRDARAFVASQDGRFTVFSWSPSERMVRADRVETLLL